MEEKLKVFLCEDDENLGMLLREYLQVKGYDTDLYPDGEAGAKGFTKTKYDLCIIDVMMPKKDGITLVKEIRQINTDIPVIFLTAKNMKEDVLEGFNRRVKGKKSKEQNVYNFGTMVFDTQKQLLTINGEQTKLTTKESELLSLLCMNANDILERSHALKQIWEEDSYFNARSMDVYITKLRKLLKADPNIEIINIHGKGYKLIVPEIGEPEN